MMIAAGESVRTIVIKVGVSKSLVANIVNSRTSASDGDSGHNGVCGI